MSSLKKLVGRRCALLLLVCCAALFFGCSGSSGSGGGPGGALRLNGMGATFPNPLYQKWVSEYGKLNQHLQIDYQSQGSGAGTTFTIELPAAPPEEPARRVAEASRAGR
ncbi:MAG TPA: hypothetical protein VF723_17445 [Pyrinomonadaceae bacterium]|jgi:phosphate transport system substrate-binding protein